MDIVFKCRLSLDDGGNIDGAIAAEQITDAEAFNVWFIALAEPYDGSTEKAHRLDVKLSPIGFDQADKASMIAALVTFKSEYDQIMSGRAALAAGAASAGTSIDQLRASEDSLVAGTRETLQATLSAPAWSRVNAWVTGHVKAHTKAYIVQH